ncbi:MAG TPA: DUF1326 domain-containing protein [Candidatus Methylomirabilis sp.]
MAKTYQVEGYLLEACSCGAPCPCWIGEDPDGGKCDAFNAYRIQKGKIKGVDVSGVTFAFVIQIPGNALKGNWKIVVYVSDKCKPAQKQAILDAWTGKLGGPLADLAKLVGEVRGVYDVPIDFQLRKGKGTLKIGNKVEARMQPFTDVKGVPTTLANTIFSNIPGNPAYVAKATYHKVNVPEHGMQWSFQNRNAIQGPFRFVH